MSNEPTPFVDAEDDQLPSAGLLSFYDRLRERVANTVEKRGGKLGPGAAQALLLAPDVFILLVRLSLDKEVPRSTRMLVGGALAYFIMPLDLMPELVLGPMGFLDDLLLSVAVLTEVLGRDMEPFAEKHWSGTRRLRTVMGDVLGSAHSLVGDNVYDRLRAMLAKRGIDLDRAGGSVVAD